MCSNYILTELQKLKLLSSAKGENSDNFLLKNVKTCNPSLVSNALFRQLMLPSINIKFENLCLSNIKVVTQINKCLAI